MRVVHPYRELPKGSVRPSTRWVVGVVGCWIAFVVAWIRADGEQPFWTAVLAAGAAGWLIVMNRDRRHFDRASEVYEAAGTELERALGVPAADGWEPGEALTLEPRHPAILVVDVDDRWWRARCLARRIDLDPFPTDRVALRRLVDIASTERDASPLPDGFACRTARADSIEQLAALLPALVREATVAATAVRVADPPRG